MSEPAAEQTALLAGRIERARAARRRVIERASTDEIIRHLAASAATWTQPAASERVRLVATLAEELGLAGGMIERALDNIFSVVNLRSISDLVRHETGDPALLEPASGRARLVGPETVLHRLAGNVTGQAIPAIVTCLVARSVCVLRESNRQPLLTEAFLNTLARHDEDLAGMVVLARWPAEDTAMETLVAGQATRVELYGSDETMAELASVYRPGPGTEPITHGSVQSLGYVTAGGADREAARGLADDIAMYEGQGCLSPHHILIEGSREETARFALLLGQALDGAERSWPRARQNVETEARRRAVLARRQALALQGAAGEDLAGPREAWHLSVDVATEFDELVPGPGTRVVALIAAASRERALSLCRRTRYPLAGVALACHEPERGPLESSLEEAGATLVCRPGRMQAPPLGWRQDGGQRLAGLLARRQGRAA